MAEENLRLQIENQHEVQRLEETVDALRTEISSLKTSSQSGKINRLADSVANALPDIYKYKADMEADE